MTYTQIGILAVLTSAIIDMYVIKTYLLRTKIFWYSYAIILFFQFVSNGMFTGFGIVKYNGAAIIGGDSPAVGSPAMFGDGRIFFAPVEDILFGFALVLLSISLWHFYERLGVQAEIKPGPARVGWFRKK